MDQRIDENEIDIKGFLNILYNYKFLIVIFMSLFFLIANFNLHFKPSIYSSSALLEVKTQGNQKSTQATDDVIQTAFSIYDAQIEKEIEILKTFNANKKVIEDLGYGIQFFKEEGYGILSKKIELYDKDIPIEIKIMDINLSDDNTFGKQIIGKMIKLTPHKDGFSLEFDQSLKEKFLNKFSENNKEITLVDSSKIFQFGVIEETNYFRFIISQKKELDRPVFIQINGGEDEDSIRSIYENIIKNKLIVSRLNENAPLIQITFEDTIPKRAANYVNALIGNFLEYKKEQKNEKYTNVLKFLEVQVPNVKKKLDKSQYDLQNYKISNQLIESSTKAKHIIGELSNIEIEISDYELKLKIVNSVLQTVHKNANMLDVIGPSLIELGDKVINSQLSRLQELETKRSLLRTKYTNEYQELAGVNSQIDNIRAKVELNIQNLKSAIQYKITNLKKLKYRLEQDLKELPEKEKKLADLTRTYEVNAKLYAYLLEKKSANQIVKAATVSDYNIAEKAYSPSIPLKPRRSLILLISIFLGFITGVVVSMLHNAISNKIHTKDDIENLTKIPLVGVVPKAKHKGIEVFNNSASSFSDSFRRIRTSLKFILGAEGAHVLLVTSVNDKDGKSTIVSNLGAIFQLAGYRSIVIDLDLRNPSLHKIFDLEQKVGVSAYLASEDGVNLGDIVFQTEKPNLDFIPVGSIPTNPSELLLSSRLETLLFELKKHYDYIIIDSSSFEKSIDVFSLLKYVDMTIVVLKKSLSKKMQVKKLEKVIAKYKLKNIAFILNGNSDTSKNEDILY